MSGMMLTHKICLDPTYQQARYFRQACGIARFTWNWALAEWRRRYELGERPSGLSLKKDFNAIKAAAFPWIYDVTKYACQQPFIFLQSAFTKFFKKQAGYPRFKKKGVHDSFYIGNDHIRVAGNRIRLPKLGWVKMREYLRFAGRVVSATVSRIANKWFVSLHVDISMPMDTCESQASVGIDLGVSCLATLFDGKDTRQIIGPKPLKRLLSKLKRLQRALSRTQKGSRNRQKMRDKVAKLHAKIRCIRQDALHKLTTYLCRHYKTIVIEDLNVKGMMANHKLARHIADMGFYECRRQLEYKALLYGNTVHVVDRWFPSSKRCSSCLEVNTQLTLSDRIFSCLQ